MMALSDPMIYYEYKLSIALLLGYCVWKFPLILLVYLWTGVAVERKIVSAPLLSASLGGLFLFLSFYDLSYCTFIMVWPFMHSRVLVRSIVLSLYCILLGMVDARSTFSSMMEKSLGSEYSFLLYFRLLLEIMAINALCIAYGSISYFNSLERGGFNIRHASINNDLDGVDHLIRWSKVDVNSQDQYGGTALHICAQQAVLDIAHLLLRAGADPNRQDAVGFTALHWAVQMRKEEFSQTNRLDLIRLLLKHGASVSLKDIHGVSPITIASRKGNGSAMSVLSTHVDQ